MVFEGNWVWGPMMCLVWGDCREIGAHTDCFSTMNSGLGSYEKSGLYTTPRSRGLPSAVGKGISLGSVLPKSCREQNGRRVQEKAVKTGRGLKA